MSEQARVHQNADDHGDTVGGREPVLPRPGRRNSTVFHGRVTRFDRWLVRQMVAVVGDPLVRISLWDGAEATPPCARPVADLHYADRGALLRTITNPELYWGDLYCNGRAQFQGDMVQFMETIYRGIGNRGTGGLLRRLIEWWGHRRIANSRNRARHNIHHHYDIGNAFYRLWLDRAAMQYTCAYFPNPDLSLEDAQAAKLHHVCRKLQLKPGDAVVEAGCGWGGLALFMARHYGVTVKAYNISGEQLQYARNRAREEGLEDRVEFVLDDYRNIAGSYDVFVSVGMLEHVGLRDYPELGRVIERCLKPEGRGLIHTIGRNLPRPMNAWIERRIFPGAYPPTLKQMMSIMEAGEMSVLDVENLRLHYVLTLRHWLERFEARRDDVERMMDAEFVRAWRLYLAGSIAAFNVGALQLFQLVFTRPGNNHLPRSRSHLYARQAGGASLSLVRDGGD